MLAQLGGKTELDSSARSRLGVDGTSESGDKAVGDREAEAGAAAVTGAGRIGSGEAIEGAIDKVGREPVSVVCDPNDKIVRHAN